LSNRQAYRDTVVALTWKPGTGGTKLDPLKVRFFVDLKVDETPSWTVVPSAFEHNMTLTARLLVPNATGSGSRRSRSTSSQLAAFVGNELRGVAPVTLEGSEDNRVRLVIYGRSAGEAVSFRVYDAESGRVFATTSLTLNTTTSQSLGFVVNGTFGTQGVPYDVAALSEAPTGTFALAAGWSWISINRAAQPLSTLFPLASLASQDVVQSQTTFSMFDTGTQRWVGSLAQLLPGAGYKVRLALPNQLQPTGAAVNPTTTAINLAAGWNWIGYTPSAALPIATALAPISSSLKTGDVIKSQTAFAQYVTGTGWVGSLTQMAPGRGYLIKVATMATLRFPMPSASAALSGDDVATGSESGGEPTADVAGAMDDLLPMTSAALAWGDWVVNPAAFSHNMTAVLALDGTFPQDALVGAFVGDSLRGIAPLVEIGGRPLAFMMTYANQPTGDRLTFRLRLPDGTERLLSPGADFQADASLGSVAEPLVLRITAATAAEDEVMPTEYALVAPFPNPFDRVTTVRFALPLPSRVRIEVFDALGREVAVLSDGELAAGWHRLRFNGDGLPSGVYVVRLRTGAFHATRRVLIVR
ncbi:MAG TPA: T9SS type A sorting domain-containing protein, partial [Rhodothermales bacterium]|nr:T9SS type A sorting domain-containing protein [Rhodothermales bacterium]